MKNVNAEKSRTPTIKETVPNNIKNNPNSNIEIQKNITRKEIHHISVWEILKKIGLHSYYW